MIINSGPVLLTKLAMQVHLLNKHSEERCCFIPEEALPLAQQAQPQ